LLDQIVICIAVSAVSVLDWNMEME
jgi:hypothetical protein